MVHPLLPKKGMSALATPFAQTRRHARVPAERPGLLEVSIAAPACSLVRTTRKRASVAVRVRDVSLGGLSVVFLDRFSEPVELAKEMPVTVRFAVDGRQITLEGSLVWNLRLPGAKEPFLAGVRLRLEAVSSVIRTTFEEWVRRKMAELRPQSPRFEDRAEVPCLDPLDLEPVDGDSAELLREIARARSLLRRALSLLPDSELADEIARYVD